MLQVGFGSADITLPVGANIPGGFFPNPSQGVRDKLLATACVMHDNKTSLALVGVDTLIVSAPVVAMARELIAKSTQIPAANVLVNASHTHSGGPVLRRTETMADVSYASDVAKGIASAVTDAWNSLHGVEIGIGTGHELNIAFNRRFRMKDGREITHPGKPGTPHHHEIVAPAGPTDPNVGALAVRPPSGEVCGIVVNFACHSTVVGGNQFSPDYPGYLRKHLKAIYGGDLPVVFLLGACGDVTQVNNLTPGSDFGPQHADMMGSKLAGEVVRTLRRMTWLNEAALAATSETIPLAYRPDPDVERERPPFGLGSGERVEEVFAQARQWLSEERKKSPTLTTEIQALRIGSLGVVANGAEFFASEGLRIKEASPFSPTWVVSLANDWIGYVPTAHAFYAGGYESRTGRASFLAADSSQRIVEASLRVLMRLTA
jgi:hypothetical protein